MIFRKFSMTIISITRSTMILRTHTYNNTVHINLADEYFFKTMHVHREITNRRFHLFWAPPCWDHLNYGDLFNTIEVVIHYYLIHTCVFRKRN